MADCKNTHTIDNEFTDMSDNIDYWLAYPSENRNDNTQVIENRSYIAVGYLIVSVMYFILGAVVGGVTVWYFID